MAVVPDTPEKVDKIRVGIIGLGWWAIERHVPEFRKTGRADIVAVSRRNPERLAMAKEAVGAEYAFTDWREMLDKTKLDAVVVSTPHDHHREPTIAALERGLHVLVEKPLALTSDDGSAMVRAAEASRRVLMVAYNARFMGTWRTVKRVLESDLIGEVRQINVVCAMDARIIWERLDNEDVLHDGMGQTEAGKKFARDAFSEGNWRSKANQMGGGMIVDSGSHMLDIMLWLGGGAATDVSAFTRKGRWEVEHIVDMQAKLSNDVTLSLAFAADVVGGDEPFYGHGRLTAIGDRGVLTADWCRHMACETNAIHIERGSRREEVPVEVQTISPAEGFLATIIDGAPNLSPADSACGVQRLTEALYESARTRQTRD